MMYAYEGWVDTHLNVKHKYGAEALVWCFNKNHQDRSPSCYFNMDTSCWICFSCGFAGSLKNDPEATSDQIQREVVLQALHRLMNPEEDEQVKTIPDTALTRYRMKNEYWEKRNISAEMQDLFELGYDPISDAVTIPLRTFDGALIGVTRRFVSPDHVGPRYKYPQGFRASQNLFASWLYEQKDVRTLCLTEGSIDAIRLWQNGFACGALYGSMISPTHVDIMRKMGVQKIIYFGDGDKAGQRAKMRAAGWWERNDGTHRYKESTDLRRDFIMYHVPSHFGKKDAGEMTDDEIVCAVHSAELYRPKPNRKPLEFKDSPSTRLRRLSGYNG